MLLLIFLLIFQSPYKILRQGILIGIVWFQAAALQDRTLSVGKIPNDFHRVFFLFIGIFRRLCDEIIQKGKAEKIVPQKPFTILQAGFCVFYTIIELLSSTSAIPQ